MGVGNICRLLSLGTLLLYLSPVYITCEVGETLDSADKRLDQLTHRLVTLSNKLDSTLAARNNGKFRVKYFAKLLDRHEGN